jgi:GWxTD domain-containing protein
MSIKKKTTFLILATFLLFLSFFELKAQDKQLKCDVDFARFRTSSDFIYLEIYYSLFRSQLKFTPDENKFRADFKIETKIFSDDSLVVQDVLDNVTFADSLSHVTPSQRLTNLSGIVIREGTYKLNVNVTDVNSKLSGSLELDLDMQSIPKEGIAISDIQLASRIQPQETTDKFCKNNYQVIPNPSGLYGTGAPILYFYAEIYNLSQEGELKQYRSKIAVVDGNGSEIRVLQDKTKNKPGTSSVEVSGFNIISLRSGAYFLRFEIEDIDSKETTSVLKKFFVYRPDDYKQLAKTGAKNFDATKYLNTPQYQYYDTLDEKTINDEFAGSVFIASNEDKKIFESLDLDGKRNFMKQFWLNRDTELATFQNEYRGEYLRRLKFVNEKYGSGKPGWKSDRGRVLLLYGESDEIERFPSSSDNRSYEIWNFYKIQGGVAFIFVDIRGFGDYILVHSTARDELQDHDWQRWIRPQ